MLVKGSSTSLATGISSSHRAHRFRSPTPIRPRPCPETRQACVVRGGHSSSPPSAGDPTQLARRSHPTLRTRQQADRPLRQGTGGPTRRCFADSVRKLSFTEILKQNTRPLMRIDRSQRVQATHTDRNSCAKYCISLSGSHSRLLDR